MASVFDYDPTGYTEWFVSSMKRRSGDRNKPVCTPNEPLNNVQAISVLDAQIPFSFYTINENNNMLIVDLKVSGASLTKGAIFIAPGNYTSDTIGPAIIAALQTPTTYTYIYTYQGVTNSIPMSWAGWPNANTLLTITFSASTGKLTFTLAGSSLELWFSLGLTQLGDGTWLPYNGMCYLPIGFQEGNPFLMCSSGGSFTSQNSISLGGPSYILLRGDIGTGGRGSLLTNENARWQGDHKTEGNVLAAIPVNALPNGTITWTNLAPRGGFFNISSSMVSEVTFWLSSGDDDRPLDLNGHSFQFKLGFLNAKGTGTINGSMYTSDRGMTSSYRY